MNVETIVHNKASPLLSDESFRLEWDSLCDRCPWATAFQSHRFARVWFSIYRRQFEPLLLTSRSAGGALQGMLVLARSIVNGSLSVVGGCQAEYQAWVCEPGIGEAFPKAALAALRREFPGAQVTFRYLPASTPTAWLADPQVSRLCLLRTHRRPVWEFGTGEGIAASLKKANNKNRLRQLKKLGPFEFTRVTNPAEVEALFDEMVGLYDLRHGAVHGALPFCSIDHQKEFHVAMLREPGLMHATVMRVGGRLAAAHFGVCSKSEVHFGTIVHDPRLAKHSPGKLQFLLLAQLLQQEGFGQADLTPGDDAYKERHATAWDEVHTLDVFPSPLARAKAAAGLGLSGAVKRLLKQRGITTCEARHQARRFRRPARAASTLVRSVCAWVGGRCETWVYLRDLGACPELAAGAGTEPAAATGRARFCIRRDAWGDLLAYHPTSTGLSRQTFLSTAMARLEAGEHAYTATDAGRLIYLAWMAERPSPEIVADALPGLAIPPDSALVQDLYLFDEAPRPLPALALRAMLRDARCASLQRAIVLDSGANTACRYLLESTGFGYAGSIKCETRFGRRHRRAEGTERLAASAGQATPAEPRRRGRLPVQTTTAAATA